MQHSNNNVNSAKFSNAVNTSANVNGISLKDYFINIRELSKGGEQFPINLDDVFPLVYSRRDKALQELRKNFIESVDFNLHQLGKVVKIKDLQNGIKIDAYLSVPAMEYFIAKKVKAVFEVYRNVFHSTIEAKEAQKPLSQIDLILQSAQILADQQNKLNTIERKVDHITAHISTDLDCFTVAGYAKLKGFPVSMIQASGIGRKASKICKEKGFEVSKIHDVRWGMVNIYPKTILDQLFNA